MSRDNRGDSSVSEKFKRFLKIDKKNEVSNKVFVITSDVENKLGPNAAEPILRIQASKDILEKLQNYKLEQGGIEKIWLLVQDFFKPTISVNYRSSIIRFLIEITKIVGLNSAERKILFLFVADNYTTENNKLMLSLLNAILSNGRNIEGVESMIQTFVLHWTPFLLQNHREPAEVFQFLTNLFKDNSAYLDNAGLLCSLVGYSCLHIIHGQSEVEVKSCFSFLEAVISFSYIPADERKSVILALSGMVGVSELMDGIWKVLKKYLQSGAANTIVMCMQDIVENHSDDVLVHGCIVLLTNSMWSKAAYSDITVSYASVLQSLYKAVLRMVNDKCLLEICNGVRKLIVHQKVELYRHAWKSLMQLLSELFHIAVKYCCNFPTLHEGLKDILTELEIVVSNGSISDDLTSYYELRQCSCCPRPLPYIIRLLDHNVENSMARYNSLTSDLMDLTQRYFVEESRQDVRLHMLLKLKFVFDKYRETHGQQLCEILVNKMSSIDRDRDLLVRQKTVALFVHIVLHLEPSSFVEIILHLIHKVVLYHFFNPGSKGYVPLRSHEAGHIFEGVEGLILIFKKKIWQAPGDYAIKAYQSLMMVVEKHYRRPIILQNHPDIRRKILEVIFELRANNNYNLGFPNSADSIIPFTAVSKELDREIGKYSPYIIVDHKYGQRPKISLPDLLLSSDDEEEESSTKKADYIAEDSSTKEAQNVADDSSNVEKDSSNFEAENEIEDSSMAEGENVARDTSKTGVDDVEDSSKTEAGNVAEATPKADGDNVAEADNAAGEKTQSDDAHENGEVSSKPVHLSLIKAAHIVLVALKKENEWPITQMILEKLPAVLENKALILSKDGNDIAYLVTILCTLISETRSDFSERYLKSPEKFNVSDFNAFIYPVLARLASYHQEMGAVQQRDVIKILQFGILSKSSPICVSAMTTCVLEMRITMVKQLRDVMLSLSKISATVLNGHPTLEFLSTLLHLPRVYSDFSPDQYMSVFAICIPYTNPFKFNHYIVSMAYHVIAMWFLKCRLPYRKQFVNFIAKNLNTILVQESTDRGRSFGVDQHKKEEMVQFHRDLRETLVDFMARYCFDSYSPTTRRSPVAEMLVENGQKQMWLLGTRVISVTTSGCSQRPMIKGVCDKCLQFCGNDKDSTPAESFSQSEEVGLRRRHRSEFNRSVSNEVKNAPQSKDDLHVENQSSNSSRYQSFLSQDGNRDGSYKKFSDSFPQTDSLFSKNVRAEIKQRLCACWCRGWAEIHIRQPTGDVSWMMRIQNEQTLVSEDELLPISDLQELFVKYENFFTDNYPGGGLQGANSADSDLASESGLTTAQSNEWSGSALSSGNNSRTSSELKLNQDSDKPSDSHSAVSYSLSNPEVNLKLAEGEGQIEPSSDRNLEQGGAEAQINPQPGLRSGSSSVRRGSSIVGCPSPSTAPFSRIRHASAAQMKSSAAAASGDREDIGHDDRSLQPMKRGRGHTISEMNPASRTSKKPVHRRPTLAHTGSLSASVAGSSDSMFSLPADPSATSSESRSSAKKPLMRGISPSAVFLQLYYQGNFGGGKMRPIFLSSQNPDIERSIRILDLTKPQETHKIGVIYVAPNQRTEKEILKNTFGSLRYLEFLGGLGKVYDMKDLPEDIYLGGYDRTGVDGDTVYMWNDQILQVIFHVATILPNSDNDEHSINKKRHIGNDFVTIVYNDSKYPYQLDTIKSQFNHSIVEIIPTGHKTNIVITHCKPEVGELFSSKSTNNARMVSDISLPVLVRQLAVHADLASMVSESIKDPSRSPYSSNWLERLKRIRNLREKVLGTPEAERQEQQANQADGAGQYLDFTDIIDVERIDNKERGRHRLFNRR